MDKREIIAFFDRCAPMWDAEMIKDDSVINKILDNAHVGQGMTVLDVACGTGVMFGYYLQRDVASVTGIDISPKMAKIAAQKFTTEDKVRVICDDVEEYVFTTTFDRIVVYNALPHFPDQARLIRRLAGLLKKGGGLTVAHGMSREAINAIHRGGAAEVSTGLMAAEELAQILGEYLRVEIVLSDQKMYQVSGVKE
jgi:demethylmenaquinone methyltransferase/2-methoxy-6-polyprenyl-1,4-benzoquinol methylase